MRKIDRSGQRRHGLDASAFNSSMFFGWFFLECPCRIAVPIDRAERLEGFGCICNATVLVKLRDIEAPKEDDGFEGAFLSS